MQALFILILSLTAVGQDANFSEINEEIVVKAADAEAAKREAVSEITNRLSLKNIKDLAPHISLDSQRGFLQNRILNNSSRYIPLVKVTEVTPLKDAYKVQVSLKFSLENLKLLLQKEGLIQVQVGPTAVLPLFAVNNIPQGKSFRWWLGAQLADKDPLRMHSYYFISRLRDELFSKGFYLLNPVSWQQLAWLPTPLRKESFSVEDLGFISPLFKAQVVIRGSINFDKIADAQGKVRMNAHLSATATSNQRLLAEARETVDLDERDPETPNSESVRQVFNNLSSDIAAQLVDTWNRGVGKAKVIQLVVKGELSYQDFERLKGDFSKNLKAAKSVKERRFEPGAIYFEVDGIHSTGDLAQALQAQPLEKFTVQVSSVKDTALWVTVKTR